jgi:hypothetical protein
LEAELRAVTDDFALLAEDWDKSRQNGNHLNTVDSTQIKLNYAMEIKNLNETIDSLKSERKQDKNRIKKYSIDLKDREESNLKLLEELEKFHEGMNQLT